MDSFIYIFFERTNMVWYHNEETDCQACSKLFGIHQKKNPKQQQLTKQTSKHKNKTNTPEL